MIESNDHWHIITQPRDDYLADRTAVLSAVISLLNRQ